MSIYNNKHVVFEQVGVDSDTVVWNQSTNTDGDGAYNNYEISNIRNAVLPTKALALSNELYATLTNTTIQTAKNGNSSTLVSTSDKTFILAVKEVSSFNYNSVQQEFNALTRLGWYVSHNQASDRIKYNSSNVACGYYLRSPYTGTTQYIMRVREYGDILGYDAADNQNIAQCFAY